MNQKRIEGIVFDAGMAQMVGTLLAMVAAYCLVGFLTNQQSESVNLNLVWLIAGPPFLVAFAGGVCLFCLRKNPAEGKVKAWIKGILYLDAGLLLVVVYATGGVEGNIFSPIFFLIPVCSVALLKHWHDEETATIRVLVGLTIACHLVSALLHKMWPIAPDLQSAPWATWITLYVCVALSAWVSIRNLSYANVDASTGVSQKEG